METQIIKYQSDEYRIPKGTAYLDDKVTDNLRCQVETMSSGHFVHFFWRFHWDEHFQARIESMTGNVTLKWSNENEMKSHTEKIEFDGPTFKTLEFPSEAIKNRTHFFYEYSVAVVRKQPVIVDYLDMFKQSDRNNFPLEVEGKLIFVNKDVLALHSKYFECLFSPQFTDSKKSQIPIGMVTVEAFGLVLSKFYPPYIKDIEDIEVEDLIKWAKVFDFEMVLKRVQDHLIGKSNIDPAKILWIAEEHLLPEVIDERLKRHNGRRRMYLMRSKYYPLLSQELQDKIAKL